MGTEDNNYDKERGRALATLRGILVSSLSRENLPLDLDDSLSPTSPPVPPTRRRRRVTFLEGGVTTEHHNGSIDAGAAPVDPSQKQTSRPSSAKQGGLHWFAHGADEPVSSFNEGKENAAVTQKDREERLRLLKERQNEDRQRKLEELKQQALAAQKFREQKEEERRRRMEELRLRDSDRRHQVEERKRQIWEAERDRREAILRKNQLLLFQEREARIESKRKNERSSIVFAFGSSTPRMLEPADTGGSYWATRRATSTSNVMMLSMTAPPGPLTRRSSERELDGSKKRATSAGGINRNKGEGLSSEHRAATAAAAASKSANVGGVDKPPLPKVHTTKKPLSAKPDLAKKPADKIKSTKSSATSTPKATPLQSPGIEVPPTSHTDEATSVTTVTSVMTVGDEMHTETVTVAVSETSEQSETVVSHKIENDKPAVPFVESEKIIEDKQQQPQRIVIDKQPTKQDSDIVTHQESSINELPEGDMTASMIARTRITTEEEAKAALAERRRLAREQAEREAELERQRLEAERLAEEERLRQEEEEQRRAEEEQLRLIEEARLAEEQRLQQAIQEAQKREEEERRRREEEERLRKEKEEADRKAKEEAEKLRQEMEIKLKKEEEDRQARRKRVEAIMLRTRGKGATPTNTPTKEDGEEVEESPGEYTKNESKNMNLQEEFLHSERNHSAAVTSAPIIHQPPPASNPFLDSINTPKHNGHRNGVDNETVEQNNVTNNLLDFSSFETTNNVNVNNVAQQPPIGEILQPISADNMPITPTNGKLSNEDNLNFNSQPFIPFQDNKKQDPNTVNDLLS
ncbi:uncharacterized protein LOC142327940 isoform X11 [Lycorma delicatula]|uniref:uncharacterized protein LOC142327940 isoform X11 n=1 Tax=Lycorma delicatula TaxID=130591 RepID=UPI003F518BA7